jgi:hypothetical protein
LILVNIVGNIFTPLKLGKPQPKLNNDICAPIPMLDDNASNRQKGAQVGTIIFPTWRWMGARVVESTGLENP